MRVSGHVFLSVGGRMLMCVGGRALVRVFGHVLMRVAVLVPDLPVCVCACASACSLLTLFVCVRAFECACIELYPVYVLYALLVPSCLCGTQSGYPLLLCTPGVCALGQG